MFKIFIGIDISKDSFSVSTVDLNGNVCFSLSASMDSSGFSELYNAIISSCNVLSSVIVGMESSGCYHINLFSFLSNKGIKTIIINPLLISNFSKLSLRKTKTDRKDALTIAKFLLVHKNQIEQFSSSQDIIELRDIAREREYLCNLIASTKNEIKRLLQLLFPELESICNVFTRTMLNFLMKFPSARTIRESKSHLIAKALESSCQGRKISVSVETIIKTAQSSVASTNIAKEIILRGKISTLLHLMERLNEITELLSSYCQSIMLEDLQILTSIDGIDTTTAATFLAEVGKIDNFQSHKKLIAYAGIDPSVYQSGKFEGKSKISKRGNRHFRRVIYIITVNVIRVNHVFRAYFLRRRNEGLPFRKAVMTTAHKLLRTIFAMLSHKSYFRVKKHSL